MTTQEDLIADIIHNAQRMQRLLEQGPALSLYREYWCDSLNGDDRNNGSQTWPFETLDRALDHVPVGGHVKIRLVDRPQDYFIMRDHRLEHALVEVKTDGAGAGEWADYASVKTYSLDGVNTYQITGEGAFLLFSNVAITTTALLNAAPADVQASLLRVKPLSSMFVNLFWCDLFINETHLMRGGVGASSYFSATSCRVDRVGVGSGDAILVHAQGNVAVIEMAQMTFVDGGTPDDYVAGVTLAADGEPRNVLANFSF